MKNKKKKKKKAWVAIFIPDKLDLKVKDIKRNKKGHFIKLKEAIQQEEITLVNIYAPNTGATKYIKKKQLLEDIKKDIDSNTIIVGDFNTPLSPLDKSSKQKNQKRNINPK
jgi:exonuclease III